MFERFSPAARHVVVGAQRQAETFGRACIGTEHIFLGVLAAIAAASPVDAGAARSEAQSDAAEALGGAGVDWGKVYDQVRGLTSVEKLDSDSPKVSLAPFGTLMPFTHQGRQICERAFRLTLQHDHPAVEPEHLLLSLTDERPSSNALQILLSLGVDLSGLHDRVRRAIATAQLPSADASPMTGEALSLALRPTPRYRQILAAAQQAALARGHHHLGVEHLMLAILDDASSVATAAVTQTGASLDAIRAELDTILREYYERSVSPSSTGG